MSKNLYDNIDPKKYEEKQEASCREKYLYEHWSPVILSFIKKYSKNSVVLDMGCGSGNYSFEMKKYANKVYGIDSSKRMIDYAQNKYPGIDFILGDATHTILKSESIDTLFSFGLFEYTNKKNLMREMYRILKKEGVGIIWIPNKNSFYRLISKFIYKIKRQKYIPDEPSFREMINLFRKNNFCIVEYKMDDGLVWLPSFLDKIVGIHIYKAVERFFKIFNKNPLSADMLFIIKKDNN